MNIMEDSSAVAVTGRGIVSPLGIGISSFGEALFKGQSFFSKLSYPELSFPFIGSIIQDFSFSDSLNSFYNLTSDEQLLRIRKIARHTPRPIQLGLLAALEAWQDADLEQRPLDTARMGIVVAAQNAMDLYQYDLQASFQKEPDYLSPTYALHFMDTNYVGILSAAFGIFGEGFTVGGASASGNVALLRACQLIQHGLQECCMVVGAVAELSPMELQGFHNIGAMGGCHFMDQPHKACRPFDRGHDGFIYGQAAGCLILESKQSAIKRGVPIFGYILGGAITLDGNHLPDSKIDGEVRAMKQAIKNAGIPLELIIYINTHGSSSPLGDETEVKAIQEIWGTSVRNVVLNSTKSMTGHCLWSAGVIEAIATLFQMQYDFVHPNLNLEHPITDACQWAGLESKPLNILVALSNSFGFGGINTSLILSKDLNS